MVITVDMLDKHVKDVIRDKIMSGLFREYSTLPTDTGRVDTFIGKGAVKEQLDDSVRNYYLAVAEHDVDVEISADDYRNVWMHTV